MPPFTKEERQNWQYFYFHNRLKHFLNLKNDTLDNTLSMFADKVRIMEFQKIHLDNDFAKEIKNIINNLYPDLKLDFKSNYTLNKNDSETIEISWKNIRNIKKIDLKAINIDPKKVPNLSNGQLQLIASEINKFIDSIQIKYEDTLSELKSLFVAKKISEQELQSKCLEIELPIFLPDTTPAEDKNELLKNLLKDELKHLKKAGFKPIIQKHRQFTNYRLTLSWKILENIKPNEDTPNYIINLISHLKPKIYPKWNNQASASHFTVYTQLFAETRATLFGKRKWFANTRAAYRKEKKLFADTRALLSGERPFLANLRATLKSKNKMQQWASDNGLELDSPKRLTK